MDAYDVVIVGTGAGGGTLARHLAPSGKRILLLERGDWLRREPANWSAHDVFVDNRYVSRTPGTTRTGRRSSRRSTTSSAARRSSTAPRSTACARRTSASFRHHDGISPAWPISYDELEPYYTQAEHLYEVHGARVRIRPSRRPALRTRFRRSRTSRGSSGSPTSSRPPASTRSMRRAASGSTRRTCPTAPACAA